MREQRAVRLLAEPGGICSTGHGHIRKYWVSNIPGPRFFQFDASLAREFRVREHETVQVRFEGFNLLNNARFMNPATTLSASGSFGTITSAFDPRILQLAMKFVF